MNRRTLFRTLAAVACAAMPVLASAQAWPERPIKFLMTGTIFYLLTCFQGPMHAGKISSGRRLKVKHHFHQ